MKQFVTMYTSTLIQLRENFKPLGYCSVTTTGISKIFEVFKIREATLTIAGKYCILEANFSCISHTKKAVVFGMNCLSFPTEAILQICSLFLDSSPNIKYRRIRSFPVSLFIYFQVQLLDRSYSYCYYHHQLNQHHGVVEMAVPRLRSKQILFTNSERVARVKEIGTWSECKLLLEN